MVIGVFSGTSSVLFKLRKLESGYCMTQSGEFLIGDAFSWMIIAAVNAIMCLIYYIKVITMIRTQDKLVHLEFLAYPLILVICNVPGIIGKFDKSHAFSYVCGGFFSSQGFLNALAYGLSKEIRDYVKQMCCKRREETPSSIYSELIRNESFSGRETLTAYGDEIN